MEVVKLGSLTKRKIGYGIVQPGESVVDGIPVIKVNNIIAGLRDVSELDTTKKENDEKYSRTRLKGGELLLSVVGTIGKTAVVPMGFAGCNLVRATALIDIPDSQMTKWVKYYIDSPKGQYYIHENLNTTVQPTLNIKSIVDMPIPLFSNEYMEKATRILSSLDDKIELNRRINENLEAQAQALFKSWFVDFEPFRDGEFVESELGMIPKGWRVGIIGEICNFENGFAFKSETYNVNGDYKVITIKNVQDGYLDSNGANSVLTIPDRMPTYCNLNIGDILLSLTGNVGRCCLVFEDNLLLNQRVAKIKSITNIFWGYVYTLFRMSEFKGRMIGIARGTAQANLSPVETAKLQIIIPSNKVLESFSIITNNYYQTMIINMIESRRLAAIRDTLLPRLMSGELKVNEKA